ncbi:MAG: hypothetical protein FJX77_16020 [Armatimonadetes bacterium]|nr:hypothetical protein [Armatimonadota bacterium]
MRILTETVIRGELLELELTELDFCPECCGTLAIAGSPRAPYLKCTSCYLVFRPRPDTPQEGS